MKQRARSRSAPDTSRRRVQPQQQAPSSFAYRAQRAERADSTSRQQSKLSDQRRRMLTLRFWARRSGYVAVVVVAVASFISVLSLSSGPRVVLLHEGGNEYAFHTGDEYATTAGEQLASSIWNRNKVTVDTANLSASLRQRYPELSSVTVTLPLIGHRPIYYLKANRPAFVLQAVNGTYVLDATGKTLIAKDAAPASAESLPVISDQTGIRARVGSAAISGQEAVFIQTVIATLAAKDTTVTSLVLPAGAAQQLDVRVAGQTYDIKFNTHEGSARQQVGTYLATINSLRAQQAIPSQYIDVRVAGRAYYQ